MLKKLFTCNAAARVLIISARRSFTAMMLNDLQDLKFVSYQHVSGELTADKPEHQRLIVQIESLVRFAADIKAFDLVVADEFSAAQSHAFNEMGPSKDGYQVANVGDDYIPHMFRGQAWEGLLRARSLVEEAQALVVLDNDLCSAQVQACVQTVRAGREYAVHINTAKPWGQQLQDGTAHFCEGESGVRSMEKRLMDQLRTQNLRRLAGDDWHGIAAACHTRTHAETLREMAIAAGVPSELIKLYTSETSAVEKERDFANATKAWEGMALIIYTGTVSVGVSCESPHIRVLFAFFTNYLMHAAQSAQMLFRARQLRSVP